MKLQIVEYRAPNILEGNIHYLYMLELDGRVVSWTGSSPSKRELKEVYGILTNGLSDGTIDLNIENYMKFNIKMIPGLDKEVIFEKEVSDAYLKELYVEKRMKAMEKDFT